MNNLTIFYRVGVRSQELGYWSDLNPPGILEIRAREQSN